MKRNIKCFVCMDKGVVPYYREENGIKYEHISHCTCAKGYEYMYNGSEFLIPSVDQIFKDKKEEIAKENYKEYINAGNK